MIWFGTSIVGSSHPGREGASKGGLFVPLKRNGELGLERRETVRPLSTVVFVKILLFASGTRGTSFLESKSF